MSSADAALDPARPRVLIAGAGVAGLETVLALRALASDRLDVTILAPELKFINLSMSVDQPFKPQRVRGLRLQDTAAELGARWHHGALDRVEPERNRVITSDGDEVRYDMLVLTLGAHTEQEWHSPNVLTYHGGRDSPNYRLLLHQLQEHRVNKVAFLKARRAELAAAPLRPRVPDRGQRRRAGPLRNRAQPRHPRGGAARDLRHARERRDPAAPGRIRGDAAYEQLRHTWSLRVA